MELISDGDCGFCQRCVTWLSAHLRSPVQLVTSQQLSDDQLASRSLSRHDVECAVWLVDESDNFAGAAAIAHVLKRCRAPWPIVGALIGSRVMSPLAQLVYRFVAKYRTRLPGSTCSLPSAQAKR